MRFRQKRKIFCIGRNKTGTTSLELAFKRLGLRVGEQAKAELLVEDWAKRDFTRIVRHCRTADAFQDVPFSLDYTYQAVDQAFPGSKFILTIRDSPDEWFGSLVRFHSQVFGNGHLPTVDDLKLATYRAPGWVWTAHRLTYRIDEKDLYNKEIYIQHYENHNKRVLDYFGHRPADLLVLNLSDPNSWSSLCRFLGVQHSDSSMPHLNRTRPSS